MQTTYKLKRDSKGRTWVTIEPLMADLAQALEQLELLPREGLSQAGERELAVKELTTGGMYQLLGAMIMEYNLREMKRKGFRQ